MGAPQNQNNHHSLKSNLQVTWGPQRVLYDKEQPAYRRNICSWEYAATVYGTKPRFCYAIWVIRGEYEMKILCMDHAWWVGSTGGYREVHTCCRHHNSNCITHRHHLHNDVKQTRPFHHTPLSVVENPNAQKDQNCNPYSVNRYLWPAGKYAQFSMANITTKRTACQDDQ